MTLPDPLRPLPFVTEGFSGTGGRIKESPEDFEVEEIPAYLPSGTGDFLYLWIEKRDMGAEFFVRQIAKRLDIVAGDIGTAGLKDRRAVTRQVVSVPAAVETRLGQLGGDGIQLLSIGRHGNKLRPGHLKGNRFRILIRDPDPSSYAGLKQLLDKLRIGGLPNFYGPQRFGRNGETAALGFAMLQDPGRQIRARFLRKLALSAAQSSLFNEYLVQRMNDCLLHRVIAGDILAKRDTGGMFIVTDVTREQSRFDAGETITTGPIFGRKMKAAAADAAARESAILELTGLTSESFRHFGKLLQGTRRTNLIYPAQLTCDREETGLRLSFELPAGAYATILLREVMKPSDTLTIADEG